MRHGIARTLAALATALLIAGCSGDKGQTAGTPPESDTPTSHAQPEIFRDQLNALDKAKGVEGTVQEGADRERQNIDDQAR